MSRSLPAAAAALALMITALLLVACGAQQASDTPFPGAAVPTARPPEKPSGTPATLLPAELTPPAPSVLTLTVWTTEAFSPTETLTQGRVLAGWASELEEAEPPVRLVFVPKMAYGKGGILDYLLTTGAVVPDLLPDLVFIDVDELSQAVQAGLVQPLDDLLPADLVADLYPFAREACTTDGKLYGVQFQADLDHLIYNAGKMAGPPASWAELLSQPGPYLFPAGGQAGLVNDAFWIQYLSVDRQAGGEDSGKPLLQEEKLVAVFQFYMNGVSRGVFPLDILSYHSSDDSWRDYLMGKGSMAQVGAHRYLVDRGRSATSAAAPIPGASGPAASISRGWALALITRDPIRQAASVRSMAEWLAPETHAAWASAALVLPTRQGAVAQWELDDAYRTFIHEQLLAARPRPRLSNYNQVAAELQQALGEVISGELTPEEAAAQALTDER